MDIIIRLLQAIAALFASIGTLLIGVAAVIRACNERKKKKAFEALGSKEAQKEFLKAEELKAKLPHKKQRKFNIVCFGISLVLIAILFLIASLIIPFLQPKVEITNPSAGQEIEVRIAETGSGSFTVSGTSSKVYKKTDLRVYVLVHPATPFAAGWWIQPPATVVSNGEWSMLAWIGSPQFPPHQGQKIEIMVLAANPINIPESGWIDDPKVVKPEAQSDIVKISIGSLIR